jgi:hypothetical protein
MPNLLRGWFGHWICPGEAELIEYSLDGLQGQDRLMAQKHLRHCRHCREQVREFLLMNASLALNAPEAEPPQGLEQSILEGIRRRGALEGPAPRSLPARAPSTLWGRAWSWLGPACWLAALALLLVLFHYRDAIENARFSLGPPREHLDPNAGPREKTALLLSSPKLAAFSLNPMEDTSGNTDEASSPVLLPESAPCWARLFLVDGESKGVLACHNLPPSAGGESYALWRFTQQEGSPKKCCGVFQVVSKGSEIVWLDLKETMNLKPKGLCFGVTREKARADFLAPLGELLLLGRAQP